MLAQHSFLDNTLSPLASLINWKKNDPDENLFCKNSLVWKSKRYYFFRLYLII